MRLVWEEQQVTAKEKLSGWATINRTVAQGLLHNVLDMASLVVRSLHHRNTKA